ncbi:hypothetical protein TNCV_4703131 [Trichonephila clavipes]|nr:hypothetical protein TNCV_4703131 [Trichonephila clavipes]
MGAVLTQLNEQGEEHPILYLREKWMRCHRNEKFSKSNEAWLSGELGKLPTVHRLIARSTIDWYDDNGANRMDWPTQRTDMIPIENLLDELNRRIKGCSNHPISVKEITCFLQAERKKISLTIIQLESMPRSVKDVIS